MKMQSFHDHPSMIYGRAVKMFNAYTEQCRIKYEPSEEWKGSDTFLTDWAPKEAALDFAVRYPDVTFVLADDGAVDLLEAADRATFEQEAGQHWQLLFDAVGRNPERIYYARTLGVAHLTAAIVAEWERLRTYLEKFPDAQVSIGAKGKPVFADDEWQVHFMLSTAGK